MPRPVDLKNRHLALLLAWLVPGLGHFYQGRIGKGILYSTSILSLFFVGMILGNWRVVYWSWQNPLANTETFCFPYIFQFWTGLVALPALIQGTLVHYGHQLILWEFMSVPGEKEHLGRGLYQPLGKFLEIGSLYTMVAGLLNILAMYDAFEGPAHPDEDTATTAVPSTSREGLEVGVSA